MPWSKVNLRPWQPSARSSTPSSVPRRPLRDGLSDGGRLIYAGAGTSGRLAVQDGAELMPTFNWPRERLLLLMAGGDQAMIRAVEGAEDERAQAEELIRHHAIDCQRRPGRGGRQRHHALYRRVHARSQGRSAR